MGAAEGRHHLAAACVRRRGLHQHLKTSHAGWLQKIEQSKQMDKDAETELTNAITAFKKSFA